jgi:heptosyltransferase II
MPELTAMRVMFIKLGAIGDVIQAAAALQVYRVRHPESKVVWVTSEALRSLVSYFDVADEIIYIDDSILINGSVFKRLFALTRIVLRLGKVGRKVGRVVTAYSDWRYRLLSLLVFAPERRHFSRHGSRPLPLHHRNRVFEYLALLEDEGVRDLDIAAAMREIGRNFASDDGLESQQKVPNIERAVVLLPGGAKNALRDDALRRWPLVSYVELARRLNAIGIPVIVAGGGGDFWICPAFSETEVIDLVGKTNLPQLWNILNRASAIVCHDSGPMHLAMTTDTPLVALLGPTPANAIVPMGRIATCVLHLQNEVACSPCYDGRNYADCSRAVCMERIDVDMVFEATVRLRAERRVCA